jgi:hypothetical protein
MLQKSREHYLRRHNGTDVIQVVSDNRIDSWCRELDSPSWHPRVLVDQVKNRVSAIGATNV